MCVFYATADIRIRLSFNAFAERSTPAAETFPRVRRRFPCPQCFFQARRARAFPRILREFSAHSARFPRISARKRQQKTLSGAEKPWIKRKNGKTGWKWCRVGRKIPIFALSRDATLFCFNWIKFLGGYVRWPLSFCPRGERIYIAFFAETHDNGFLLLYLCSVNQ